MRYEDPEHYRDVLDARRWGRLGAAHVVGGALMMHELAWALIVPLTSAVVACICLVRFWTFAKRLVTG